MSLVLVTAPAEEPISLIEAKAFSRIDLSDDDALITSLIVTGRQAVEAVTGRALVTQTWDLYADAFPASDRGIVIPKPRLESVGSVQYTDPTGALQTLATSSYAVDLASEPGWIVPAFGQSWPQTEAILNAVKVRFTSGYGAAAAVPDWIKTAVKVAVEWLYDHRGAADLRDLHELLGLMLADDRIPSFG